MVSVRCIPLLAVIFSHFCAAAAATSSHFSGVYQPNIQKTMELYAASYLVPTKLFLQASLNFETGIANLEGSTFAVIWDLQQKALMTRDYFDMFVEHLSALTNIADSPLFLVELIKKMTANVNHYKRVIEKLRLRQSTFERPFQNNTIFILPFSTKGHVGQPNVDSRLLFFQLSYYAAYLHFPNIAVAIADEFHAKELEKLNLVAPPFHVFKCYRPDEPFVPHMMMKDMLMKTANQLKENPNWSHFEYVYYSESDQILHMQNERDIYDLLKANNDELFIVPHRLNAMQLPKEAPKELQKHAGESWRAEVLKDATLIVEAPFRARGSCCDDGRWDFPNCGNWWYNCQDHGIRNATAWLKFSENGFTFPLITEHLGRCKYSPVKIMCDMPLECKNRVPHGGVKSTFCKELPHIN